MSKITLVRLDGDAKHEVEIPVGETIIGRGPVMQCTDKRVSRTHAQIKVSEDGTVELTSTSLNPCYYNDDKVITKSSSVELKIGDRFSFLPDSYCYGVKASPPNAEEGTSSSDIITNGVGTEDKPLTAEENGPQSVNPEAVCTIEVTPAADDPGGESAAALVGVGSAADLSAEMTDPDVSSDGAKDAPTDASPSGASKFVPKWLLAATERAKRRGEQPSGEESGTKKAKTENVEKEEEKHPAQDASGGAEEDAGEADAGAPEPAPPPSAVHQMSDDSESEEPAAAKSPAEDPGRKQSPPRPASGGTQEKMGSGGGEAAAADRTRDRSPVQPVRREPCKYGIKCYRKNPQHRAEFSHPGDPDYKDDDRPECPYGTECYRKNPIHWQTYKHTKKPEKRTKKKQRVKKGAPKDADENSEEDDYDYDDPFLNDASSDDYEPTDSGSDETASEGEEEEDTNRMKKEAKRFVRGKRKH